ncbi:hypothetical protein ACTU44_17670 [Thalassospira sp. SM2505]|uniref:hypothetical protein n=1 Tax=Thalassospira profundimaris TaxID=502049 RepID=UPI000DEDD225|nr:hypothetical protein [Thalassospira profundimaris]
MRKLLHKKESGHLGQYEDWWYLIEDTEGLHVLHKWNHVRVNGLSVTEGDEKFGIDEFLAGNFSVPAQAKLKELIS